ncbi:hypothetical protein ACAF76_016550 [Brevibacillus sp. TJ4]|uniref:hypothetical protein n=1 Tax=Brevibacillus sp. TJ4 TaxID=3234853 RepID=UPI0037D98504
MKSELEKAFQTMLDNWERMKRSVEDDAEEDADQFQSSFYKLTEQLRDWFGQRQDQPKSLDEAMQTEEISRMLDRLPAELLLNFETELELIVEGQQREEDARYD